MTFMVDREHVLTLHWRCFRNWESHHWLLCKFYLFTSCYAISSFVCCTPIILMDGKCFISKFPLGILAIFGIQISGLYFYTLCFLERMTWAVENKILYTSKDMGNKKGEMKMERGGVVEEEHRERRASCRRSWWYAMPNNKYFSFVHSLCLSTLAHEWKWSSSALILSLRFFCLVAK